MSGLQLFGEHPENILELKKTKRGKVNITIFEFVKKGIMIKMFKKFYKIANKNILFKCMNKKY